MTEKLLTYEEFRQLLTTHNYLWNTRETKDLILDALTKRILTPVFHYEGKISACYFINMDSGEECEVVKETTHLLKGYFYLSSYNYVDFYVDAFKNPDFGLDITDSSVMTYRIYGTPAPLLSVEERCENNIELCQLYIKDHLRLNVDKLVYPVNQVYKLLKLDLKQPNSQVIVALEKENETLRHRLYELEDKLNITTQSARKLQHEGQGDSLLILGAVMESIKAVAKQNYTQESLISTILDQYSQVSGISESTLKKKISEAKNHLKQRLN